MRKNISLNLLVLLVLVEFSHLVFCPPPPPKRTETVANSVAHEGGGENLNENKVEEDAQRVRNKIQNF
jgi:hypothetical protein